MKVVCDRLSPMAGDQTCQPNDGPSGMTVTREQPTGSPPGTLLGELYWAGFTMPTAQDPHRRPNDARGGSYGFSSAGTPRYPRLPSAKTRSDRLEPSRTEVETCKGTMNPAEARFRSYDYARVVPPTARGAQRPQLARQRGARPAPNASGPPKRPYGERYRTAVRAL